MNHHQDAQNTFPANSRANSASSGANSASSDEVFFELAEFPYELALPKIWFFEKLAIGEK